MFQYSKCVEKFKAFAIFGLASLSMITKASSEPLFEFKGKVYDVKDLEARHKLKLFEADNHRYRVRAQVIEDAVLELYFKEIAAKSGKTVEAVRKEKTSVAEPTDAELKKFYEENRKKIPYPFEQVKADLTRFVKQKSVQGKRLLVIEEVKKSGKYKNLTKAPVAPKIEVNTEGFYHLGDKKSKVSVVEFADYLCPHCKEASHVFKDVLKKYKTKISFTFIDYPIIRDSFKIAEGAFCAHKMNKYWEFHEAAFENQGKLKTSEEIAKTIGLDAKKFKSCVDAREGKAIVDKGRLEGGKAGVSGTPTVFINGIRYSGGYTVKDLSQAIDKALAN